MGDRERETQAELRQREIKGERRREKWNSSQTTLPVLYATYIIALKTVTDGN